MTHRSPDPRPPPRRWPWAVAAALATVGVAGMVYGDAISITAPTAADPPPDRTTRAPWPAPSSPFPPDLTAHAYGPGVDEGKEPPQIATSSPLPTSQPSVSTRRPAVTTTAATTPLTVSTAVTTARTFGDGCEQPGNPDRCVPDTGTTTAATTPATTSSATAAPTTSATVTTTETTEPEPDEDEDEE